MITLLIIAMAVSVALFVSAFFAYEAFHGPTELIYYDREKACNGYTLFTHTHTFLIDMEGNVVNLWDIPAGFTIEKTARLLENGNLLRALRPLEGKPEFGGTGIVGAVFQEVTWNGKVVWEWKDPRPNYVAHHNFQRIYNKKLKAHTTIVISTRGTGNSIYLSHEEAVGGGADPTGSYKDARPDGIVEVDMDGNVVWEWWSFDHVVQDKNPDWPNDGVIAHNPQRFNQAKIEPAAAMHRQPGRFVDHQQGIIFIENCL